MKPGYTLFLLLFSVLTASITARAQLSSSTTTAPYLLAGSPTFDLSISQFRENFNRQNPDLPLNEFRAIENSRDKANLTRAASKINENLYASTALERGTLKVKKYADYLAANSGTGTESSESESAGIYGRHYPYRRPVADKGAKPEKTAKDAYRR
ncbi:Putative uncharacterized protein YiiQ [Salmonella enterica subsp. arizonae]|uniref:Uncharacterized protein n=1 Tax=Salmonella enterica subsp. arizonae TaxID=59203 RepID=A0A379T2Z9_SALER|nr:Putative uncharacterized protein YiiQ [Salmonella enterica subsp. arizonae]